MNRTNGILGLYTETAMHPGTGQNVGSIDLPVRREKHTSFPLIPSSSLKGSFRSLSFDDGTRERLFGSKLGSANPSAGSLLLSDARLLLFPVRSLRHGFVWVTTPFVLHRLSRDLRLMGLDVPELYSREIPSGIVKVSKSSSVGEQLILEDLILTAEEDDRVSEIADRIGQLCLPGDANQPVVNRLKENVVIVSLSDFIHLVTFGTEIVARNVLDEETKTSKNLWYMELIPRDTLFYLIVSGNSELLEPGTDFNPFDEFSDVVNGKYIQVGGHESLGHGWCLATVNDDARLKSLFGGLG